MNSDLSRASAAKACELARTATSASRRIMVSSSIREVLFSLHSPRILHDVKPPILSAAEKVGDLVSIKINDGRADVVALDVLVRQRSGILERPQAVLETRLLEEVGVRAVEEEIHLPVAIPVGDAELPPAALAGRACVELERFALFIDERF